MRYKIKVLIITGALGTALLSACTTGTEVTTNQLTDVAYKYEEQLRTQEGDESIVVTSINREETGNFFNKEVKYSLEYFKSYGLESCSVSIMEGSSEFTDSVCNLAEQK